MKQFDFNWIVSFVWKENFNIYATQGQGFVEGNSLNYSFFVPHDVKGMIELMGGNDAFILDKTTGTVLLSFNSKTRRYRNKSGGMMYD